MEISDHDIVIKLQSCSGDSARLLSNKYYEVIVKIAINFGIHQSDSEEIGSDVLLKVVDNIHGFQWEHKNSLYAWIKSITIHLCIDFRKRKANEFRDNHIVSLKDIDRISTEVEIFSDQESEDLPESISSIPINQEKNFISELSEEDKICLLMRSDNHTYKEISEILNIDEQNLRKRMSRIKSKLNPTKTEA